MQKRVRYNPAGQVPPSQLPSSTAEAATAAATHPAANPPNTMANPPNTMDHSGVLLELLLELPQLVSRLQTVAPSLPDYGSGMLTAVNPGGTELLPPSPPPPGASAVAEKTRLGSSGTKYMNAKPKSAKPKAKFSSITGPDIYFDGKSQKCLFDCWKALMAKCNALLRVTVQIQRKMSMARLMAKYDFDDSDDELETAAEAAKSCRCRFDKEVLHAEEARKEEDECRVLEFICNSLHAAAQACEEAATAFLKGEGGICQVVSINARIMDAAHQINITLGRYVPSGGEGFGEGLGDGVSKVADHLPEEELPHKPCPLAASAPALAGDDTRFRRRLESWKLAEVAI